MFKEAANKKGCMKKNNHRYLCYLFLAGDQGSNKTLVLADIKQFECQNVQDTTTTALYDPAVDPLENLTENGIIP